MTAHLRCAFAALIVVALSVTVGGAGRARGAVSEKKTLRSGGIARTYTVYRPEGLRGRAPLVLVLHGTPATGLVMEGLTGFDGIADRGRFVVAYPDAIGAGTAAGLWQVGCCSRQLRGGRDLRYVSDLIAHLTSSQHLDSHRVYVVGFSLGAAMAYRVACQLSDRVAAIGSVSGFQYLSQPCRPRHPVGVYEIHGTADLYGGSCGGKTTTNHGCGFGEPGYEPSVPQLNRQWRRIDDCQGPRSTSAFGIVTRQTWARCAAGKAVRLDTVANGGHCYPRPGSCGGYDASLELWRFLSGQRTVG